MTQALLRFGINLRVLNMNNFLKVILLCGFLSGCGLSKNFDRSHEDLERAHQDMVQTHEAMKATQDDIKLTHDNMQEMMTLLRGTQVTIKETQKTMKEVLAVVTKTSASLTELLTFIKVLIPTLKNDLLPAVKSVFTILDTKLYPTLNSTSKNLDSLVKFFEGGLKDFLEKFLNDPDFKERFVSSIEDFAAFMNGPFNEILKQLKIDIGEGGIIRKSLDKAPDVLETIETRLNALTPEAIEEILNKIVRTKDEIIDIDALEEAIEAAIERGIKKGLEEANLTPTPAGGSSSTTTPAGGSSSTTTPAGGGSSTTTTKISTERVKLFELYDIPDPTLALGHRPSDVPKVQSSDPADLFDEVNDLRDYLNERWQGLYDALNNIKPDIEAELSRLDGKNNTEIMQKIYDLFDQKFTMRTPDFSGDNRDIVIYTDYLKKPLKKFAPKSLKSATEYIMRVDSPGLFSSTAEIDAIFHLGNYFEYLDKNKIVVFKKSSMEESLWRFIDLSDLVKKKNSKEMTFQEKVLSLKEPLDFKVITGDVPLRTFIFYMDFLSEILIRCFSLPLTAEEVTTDFYKILDNTKRTNKTRVSLIEKIYRILGSLIFSFYEDQEDFAFIQDFYFKHPATIADSPHPKELIKSIVRKYIINIGKTLSPDYVLNPSFIKELKNDSLNRAILRAVSFNRPALLSFSPHYWLKQEIMTVYNDSPAQAQENILKLLQAYYFVFPEHMPISAPANKTGEGLYEKALMDMSVTEVSNWKNKLNSYDLKIGSYIRNNDDKLGKHLLQLNKTDKNFAKRKEAWENVKTFDNIMTNILWANKNDLQIENDPAKLKEFLVLFERK